MAKAASTGRTRTITASAEGRPLARGFGKTSTAAALAAGQKATARIGKTKQK